MKSWGPRACLVYLARVADAAERYEDLLSYVRQFVQFPGEMTPLERNLFCIAFKNITSQHRFSLRNLASIQVIAKSVHPDKTQLIVSERNRYSRELRDLCNEVLQLVEAKLLPSAKSDEYRIFCYKTRGDYSRYLVEVANTPEEREQFAETSFLAYREAHKIACSALPPTHLSRLGLALNYSVFFYDVQRDPHRACLVAKEAYDAAIEALDDLDEKEYRDAVVILQLLRDNVIIWIDELGEDAFEETENS